jgi:hypothetical protein
MNQEEKRESSREEKQSSMMTWKPREARVSKGKI